MRGTMAGAMLTELADEMCRCTDQHCTSDVTGRLTTWGQEMAPYADWSGPEFMKQFSKDNRRLTGCLSRIVTMDVLRQMGTGDPDSETDESPSTSTSQSTSQSASQSTPQSASQSTSTSGDHARLVRLPRPGPTSTAVHDAVRTIAEECDLSLVMPGVVTSDRRDELPPVPCDRALDVLTRSTGLAYEVGDAGILRIARGSDLTAARSARADRTRRGIVDDPLPGGQHVSLKFGQAPIRDMIELLAGSGGVRAALPAKLDGTVTVHVARVAWDRALIAVLDTAGLGYRYDAASKRLRIAPRAELDAEREREPHGFLEVKVHADTRVAIDGVAVEVASGIPLQLAPGSHRVAFTRTDGQLMTFTIDITPGGRVPLHD
jgi:hypothetical protein